MIWTTQDRGPNGLILTDSSTILMSSGAMIEGRGGRTQVAEGVHGI
jgi:hypothetical protein